MPCVHLVVQACEADQGIPDVEVHIAIRSLEQSYFIGSRRRGQREKAVISRQLCKGPARIVKSTISRDDFNIAGTESCLIYFTY